MKISRRELIQKTLTASAALTLSPSFGETTKGKKEYRNIQRTIKNRNFIGATSFGPQSPLGDRVAILSRFRADPNYSLKTWPSRIGLLVQTGLISPFEVEGVYLNLDKNGRVVQTQNASLDGTLTSDSQIKYDGQERIAGIITTDQKGGKTNFRVNYNDKSASIVNSESGEAILEITAEGNTIYSKKQHHKNPEVITFNEDGTLKHSDGEGYIQVENIYVPGGGVNRRVFQKFPNGENEDQLKTKWDKNGKMVWRYRPDHDGITEKWGRNKNGNTTIYTRQSPTDSTESNLNHTKWITTILYNQDTNVPRLIRGTKSILGNNLIRASEERSPIYGELVLKNGILQSE